MTENKKIAELHGCIICGRLFELIAEYTPDNHLISFYITSSLEGHTIAYKQRPLVACNKHTKDEIDVRYQRWLKERQNQDEIHEDEQTS